MSEAPSYVIAEEWKDEDWLFLQMRSLTEPMTDAELRRLVAGPRRHPFGPAAFQVMRGGLTVVYPDREAAGV